MFSITFRTTAKITATIFPTARIAKANDRYEEASSPVTSE